MRRLRSSCSSGALGLLLVAAAIVAPRDARAQACCAAGSVITPARLMMREDALVGVQARAGLVLGSYDEQRRFVAQRSGDSEVDLEQDLFGAWRALPHMQLALFLPIVETRRATPQLQQLGGGLGDINGSVRYDFTEAGMDDVVPGIAALAGVTAPTGRATDAASPPLQADATGIGAWQVTGALAVEQTFGSWLANATALLAARTSHDGETLAPQATLLLAGAYRFPNDASVALSASYAFEGDASCSAGVLPCSAGATTIPGSGKAVTTVTASGLWPFAPRWRALASLYSAMPVDTLGYDQLAATGLSLTAIHSWM